MKWASKYCRASEVNGVDQIIYKTCEILVPTSVGSRNTKRKQYFSCDHLHSRLGKNVGMAEERNSVRVVIRRSEQIISAECT